MRPRSRVKLLGTSLLVAAILALAGCATTNRVATINLETPGATVATTLEKQLAIKGFPSARVTCKRTLLVNVGTVDTCAVSGAGANTKVLYAFRNYTGKVDLSSVKVR
jgi:hypothetical protein